LIPFAKRQEKSVSDQWPKALVAPRTGFEPATTRFADDVTAIFTTDREESWRGTGDAVAALAGEPPFGVRDSNPLGAVAPYHEVTGIFTTALPMLAHRQSKKHAGEQAISAPVTASQALLSEDLCCGAWQPLQGRLHSACVKGVGGCEVSDIFTTSVG
jgi:hypothetical protein